MSWPDMMTWPNKTIVKHNNFFLHGLDKSQVTQLIPRKLNFALRSVVLTKLLATTAIKYCNIVTMSDLCQSVHSAQSLPVFRFLLLGLLLLESRWLFSVFPWKNSRMATADFGNNGKKWSVPWFPLNRRFTVLYLTLYLLEYADNI